MIHESDLALSQACARGDPDALARVEADCFPEVRAALARMPLTPDQVVDVMQALRTDMFVRDRLRAPRIGSYEGRGRLVSWLRVSATRLALRYLRRDVEVISEESLLLDACAPGDDPATLLIKEACRSEFKAAFQEALESLSGRERTMLRMHMVDGLSIDDLGAFHRVHRATAARWLARAKTTLLDRTRKGLMRRARVSRDECESMIRLVESQLGATLRRRIVEAG
jgi:RNA polymerase sigma-70 factor (ECF subfamily)